MRRSLQVVSVIALIGLALMVLRSRNTVPHRSRGHLLAHLAPDAGAGKRLRLFPADKVPSKMSHCELLVQHSGRPITEREVAVALPGLLIKSSDSSAAAGIRVTVLKEIRAPGEDLIRQFSRGLDEQQRAAATKIRAGTLLEIQARTGPEGLRILRKTQAAIVTLARSRSGFIWDGTTRELFTPDAFEERRVKRWTEALPTAADHFTIHVYRSGELFRVVTLGMQKFGLPDLTVEDSVSTNNMANLVNLVAQTLLEGRLPKEGKLHVDLDAVRSEAARKQLTGALLDGATKKADLIVLEGRPDQGDPENALMELWFGEPAQEKQELILSQIWGSKDQVTWVRPNQSLEAESRREREKAIREIKPHFQRGELNHHHLMVKLPFREDDHTEWMWIEVTHWGDHEVQGVLQNDPQIVHVGASGAHVAASENEIFDYLLSLPDGGWEGNTSARLLMNEQSR